MENLKKILKIEKGKISDQALILIAKAAEGSVRDSLSLLDRAIVSQEVEEKEIDETSVRKMLGIADRSKILDLLNWIFRGDQKKSILQLREMINEGIEPKNFLNDLLEIIYYIQQKKNIGNFDSELFISEAEEETINSISKDITVSTLIVFWQLILKVLEELSIVSSAILSLEMLVIRLVHLKGMPTYENVLDSLKKDNLERGEENNNKTINFQNEKKLLLSEENETTKISKDQIKNTIQTKPYKNINFETVSSFEDLILLSSKKKEINLKYDLENNVNLIKFSERKIDISFNEKLDKNFVRNLSEKLHEWTGNRWVITLAKEKGQKTYSELKSIRKKEMLNEEKKGKIYKKFKNVFSDGELLEVKKID